MAEGKFTVSLSMNVDLNTLFDQITNLVGTVIKPTGATSSSPNGNDRFVSLLGTDQVVAAYYHPDKYHYSRAQGKTDTNRSYAPAGKWAVAVAIRGLWGNKTWYGTD